MTALSAELSRTIAKNHPLLKAIIPVKNRFEIKECALTLAAIAKISGVIVCDGGSTDAECVQFLDELERQDKIRVLRLSAPGFNKSALINAGIVHSTAECWLISDADILWNEAAIDDMLSKVLADSQTICCVQDVRETKPDTIALKRDRYGYNIRAIDDAAYIDVFLCADKQSDLRPGCGLICARRNTLTAIGGYKELFQGWGWEDQDLLIRAKLFGNQICEAGRVLHKSHEDTTRNRYHNNLQPTQTELKNIVASMKSLKDGILFGDLSADTLAEPKLKSVCVQLPKSLNWDII